MRIAILQVVKSAQGLVELGVWTDLLGSAWAGAGCESSSRIFGVRRVGGGVGSCLRRRG